MDTAKSIIGLISVLLAALVMLQSCAASTVESGLEQSGANSGSIGMLVAICFLVGGLEAIASRKNRARGILTVIFYTMAALLALAARSVYNYLLFWGVLSAGFAGFFLLAVTREKRQARQGDS